MCVPDFPASLGDLPAALYLLFIIVRGTAFGIFTTNMVWLNQSSEDEENKTNPQLNATLPDRGFGGFISEQSHCWQGPYHPVGSRPSDKGGMGRPKQDWGKILHTDE